MTRRRGQATVEWIGVLAIAATIAATVAGVGGSIAPDGRAVGAALAAIAGGPVGIAAHAPHALAVVDGGSVVEVAERVARLGIVELPPGSNRGPGVDLFTGGRAEPWCADFVSWVLRAAGHPLVGGEDGWRLPWTVDVRDWFARRGRFRERDVAEPQPGDVVWFVHGHVGIVVAVRGDVLETIEGNSADAVRRVTYAGWRANRDIGGFGRVVAPPASGMRAAR